MKQNEKEFEKLSKNEIKKIELSKNEIIIAKTIFDFFENTNHEALITYGGLSKKLNEIGLKHKADVLHKPLDSINRWCNYYYNAPMISVIVINHAVGRPGDGFYKSYRDIKKIEIIDSHKNEIFLNEWKKVRYYQEWDNLHRTISDLFDNIPKNE